MRDPEAVYTDEASALRVEGIEAWIATLIPVGEPVSEMDVYLRVMDPKTNAVFLIRRVE